LVALWHFNFGLNFFPRHIFNQYWSLCILCMTFQQTYAMLLSLYSPVSCAFSLLWVFIIEILDYSYLAGGWGGDQIAALLTVIVIETIQFLAITFLCPMSLYNWVHYMLSRSCITKVSFWRLINGLVHTISFAL